MPKRIIEMVREKRDRIEANPVEAEENAVLAVAAITFGIKSGQWKTYMSQFVEDSTTPLGQKQLSRLLATDTTLNDPDLDRRRAYMVANAICGGASTGNGAAQPINALAAVAEQPSGGGAVNSAASAPAQAADTTTMPGRRLDFLVNTIDRGLGLNCLEE